MSATFTEAWDLLFSETSPKSDNSQNVQASAIMTSLATSISKADVSVDGEETISSISPGPVAPFVNRFRPRPARSAPESEDQDEERPRTFNSQSVAETEVPPWPSGSAHEFAQDVTRLLQSLRNDLNTLESSGFAPDEQNNDAINQLGRKLERLTEAVVSSTSSAAAPMKDSRPSNTKGHPPSASRDSDHDLRCWEPCCDGRKFSNKSNIIRHQRERSGELGKFRCSFCNACFSRSSSRNAHEARRCCGT